MKKKLKFSELSEKNLLSVFKIIQPKGDWKRHEKFYYDEKFNEYYAKWLETNDNWIKPSLDHVVPISKGGNSELSNFQYLTWFANHAKINMSHQEWNGIKSNINDYI
jgi:5-methylcytosine-specific restriction endonuclease McrA